MNLRWEGRSHGNSKQDQQTQEDGSQESDDEEVHRGEEASHQEVRYAKGADTACSSERAGAHFCAG